MTTTFKTLNGAVLGIAFVAVFAGTQIGAAKADETGGLRAAMMQNVVKKGGKTIRTTTRTAPLPVAPGAMNGKYLDLKRHVVVMDNDTAGLDYAKAICHGKGLGNTPNVPDAAYDRCMRGEGYLWAYDTPAEIAAREQAARDEQGRRFLRGFGHALAAAGAQMRADAAQQRMINAIQQPVYRRPTNCTAMSLGAGYATINCN